MEVILSPLGGEGQDERERSQKKNKVPLTLVLSPKGRGKATSFPRMDETVIFFPLGRRSG
jgi:hypothetical protein